MNFQVVNVGDMPTALNPASDTLISLRRSDGRHSVVRDGLAFDRDRHLHDRLVPCFPTSECKGNLGPAQGVTITALLSVNGPRTYLYGDADPFFLIRLEFAN